MFNSAALVRGAVKITVAVRGEFTPPTSAVDSIAMSKARNVESTANLLPIEQDGWNRQAFRILIEVEAQALSFSHDLCPFGLVDDADSELLGFL